MVSGRNFHRRDHTEIEVSMDTGRLILQGTLGLPRDTEAIVLFAHGSGSSRRSPRNRYVAHVLQSQGIGTLLLDLLTVEEESIDNYSGQLRFDIPLLASRLIDVTRWLIQRPEAKRAQLGYFGASTGAAAALCAAAQMRDTICAVVSRGGRPDLAGDALDAVGAPTLLIVGGDDEPVIGMNQEALARLRCEKKLVIVPGATHLFEEPGTLEEVARLAAEWFQQHFVAADKRTVRDSTPP